MIYIPVAAFTAVLRIPDSAAGDTVTYSLRKASDGSVFASGVPTWIGDSCWSVAFTPAAAEETYVLTLTDTTLSDVQTSESYKALVAAPAVATPAAVAVTAAELLAQVNAAISALMTGGAVQSYMIGNRQVMNMSLDQLQRLRDQLRREVNAGQRSTLFAQCGGAS